MEAKEERNKEWIKGMKKRLSDYENGLTDEEKLELEKNEDYKDLKDTLENGEGKSALSEKEQRELEELRAQRDFREAFGEEFKEQVESMTDEELQKELGDDQETIDKLRLFDPNDYERYRDARRIDDTKGKGPKVESVRRDVQGVINLGAGGPIKKEEDKE